MSALLSLCICLSGCRQTAVRRITLTREKSHLTHMHAHTDTHRRFKAIEACVISIFPAVGWISELFKQLMGTSLASVSAQLFEMLPLDESCVCLLALSHTFSQVFLS